jgi:membrane-associated HD superfamily phosphohydrolase
MSIGAIIRRKETTTLLFLVPAVIVLLDYCTGIGNQTANALVGWASALAMFAYLLGGIALFRYHVNRIRKRKADEWQQSIIVLVSFIALLLIALIPDTKSLYDYLFANLVTPIQTAITAYIGFYAYTIFYRACGKVKSLETAVLIGATILGLLFNASAATSMWPILADVGVWIRDVPNNAAVRAMTIGIGLGIIQLFVRTMLGLEKAYLGETGA